MSMGHTPAGRTGSATLDTITSVVLIVSALTLVHVYTLGADPPPDLPGEPIEIAGSQAKGDPLAPVVLIEWSDFECPYCRRFAKDVLPVIESEYIQRGSVQVIFKHLPLRIHANAEAAALAAECAGNQGAFWPMHDALFALTDDPSVVAFRTLAIGLELDMAGFDECLASADARGRVEGDERLAGELGFTGTPTLVLGRRMSNGQVRVTQVFRGALPAHELSAALDAELRWGWLGPIRRVPIVYLVPAGSGVIALGVVLISKRRRL